MRTLKATEVQRNETCHDYMPAPSPRTLQQTKQRTVNVLCNHDIYIYFNNCPSTSEPDNNNRSNCQPNMTRQATTKHKGKPPLVLVFALHPRGSPWRLAVSAVSEMDVDWFFGMWYPLLAIFCGMKYPPMPGANQK